MASRRCHPMFCLVINIFFTQVWSEKHSQSKLPLHPLLLQMHTLCLWLQKNCREAIPDIWKCKNPHNLQGRLSWHVHMETVSVANDQNHLLACP